MSPTIFRSDGLRFYFFSHEEPRVHVHVEGAKGEAKFWLEPRIALARNLGLSKPELSRAKDLVKTHEEEIRKAWKEHFYR